MIWLTGGSVLTLDADGTVLPAIGITDDGRIAEATNDSRAIVTQDLEGCWVLPGFTDAHVHFPSWAIERRQLSLVGTASLDEALAAVGAATLTGEGWIRGRGWRDELWGDARPDRLALDAVTGPRPCALRAADGHSLWLNTAALMLSDGQLDVPGGMVERDANGEPTGILREESAWAFQAKYLAPGFDETLAAMREALPAAAAAGVTAIHDKDGGRGAPELFGALREVGGLTLRVWQSIPPERIGDAALPAPDGWLRVGYVKTFMDGTLGSRTARLLDGTGVALLDGPGLAEVVRAAADAGMPVAVHAIGDLANREALDGFRAANRPGRHRIEHAQCVHPEDLGRFASLGVAASIQYTHATSDRDLAERLWPERIDHAYPYRSLHEAGALLAGGSDAPVEPLDPLAGLRAAVLRTSDDQPPWRPEQAIGIDAALASFTTAPAWLAFDENRRGRLLPGYDADLVVLDRDPREGLAGASVVATMVGGRWVHGPFG